MRGESGEGNVGGRVRRVRGPVVGARVPIQLRDKIDALRDLFPSADGNETSRSDVLRAMLLQAEALFDAPAIRAVREVAVTYGWDVRAAWARVISEGIRALRRPVVVAGDDANAFASLAGTDGTADTTDTAIGVGHDGATDGNVDPSESAP